MGTQWGGIDAPVHSGLHYIASGEFKDFQAPVE